MSPWLFALIFRQRVLVTETFTASRTWVAPLTTSKLETLTGEGADGTPAVPWDGTHSHVDVITYYSNGVYYSQETDVIDYFAAGRAPANYCDPVEPYIAIGAPENATRQVCHFFADNEQEATTGASTTGFGQTFAGGTGGAAVPSTVTNVAVTPGASYSLVIPSGGSLSLTYYR